MTNTYEPAENYAELEPEVEEAADKPDARPVSSQPHDWTISTLRDKYERGQINLQPHYQREYVWELKPELPSRLIESLLLQIPVPPLYFVRLNTGKIEVVDGQQRLTTLIRFVTNKFKLQKLQKLSSIVRSETINPLNDALKSAQVYDQTQHRRIQVMGDIRNRCSHSVSNPPSKEEVWELIEDVDSFIRSYPIK